MAPKSVSETSRIIHVSIATNCFLESRDSNPQHSWMKNSWCGTTSIASQTSVLLWSDVDARCVAWSLHCLSASAALPTTLVAWLMLFTSATTVLAITLVACLVLLCPAVCPAILTHSLESLYKINSDAALFENLGLASIKVVIRDSIGEVIAALSQKINLPQWQHVEPIRERLLILKQWTKHSPKVLFWNYTSLPNRANC